MKWWEIILCIIGISFCIYAYIMSYSLIFKNKIQRKNFKNAIVLLITILIAYYNTFYNYGFSKILISFLELLFLFKIIYNDKFKTCILKTILLYFLGWINEMIIGGLIFYIFFDSVESFDKLILFKVLFSILMSLMMLLFSNLKIIKKIWNKLYDFMDKKIFNVTLSIIIFIIVLTMLTYYLIVSTSVFNYLSIVIILFIISFLIITTIIQSIKTKVAVDKQAILLDFMKEYEMIIDKERIDRHEMVNNLLILKSIKNKNSKNYNKILDDILLTYQSNETPNGLYELPSGLKGLFYYKIYDMKNINIETCINISNKIIKDLDNLDSKILTKLCKILGILLDNAKEAAKESKEKIVVIDLYKEKNDIVIYIENSINKNNKIDLSKMKVKGFSTKGSNRGYGLYIVDKLLNKNKQLALSQNIDKDKFVSILKIKK